MLPFLYIRGEALAAACASADVFAFPSRTETFGQVVLEAMASRLPVVGVLSEGVCDLVRDGYTGYLLNASGLGEKEQVQEYRAKLELLVYNSELRHTLGAAGLLYARECTWSAAMQKLLDGYREVILGTRPLVAA